MINCPYCDAELDRNKDIFGEHEQRRWKCPECGKTFVIAR